MCAAPSDELAFDQLLADLDAPLGWFPLDSKTGRELLRAATGLAKAAFEEGNPDATTLVEHTLYRIHCKTAFAPPSQPVAAAVWSELMTAKLRHVLGTGEDQADFTRDEMIRRFAAAVAHADEHDHPFIDEVGAERGTEGLTVYTKNWYTSTHGFTSQLFSIGQRANARGFEAFDHAIVENLHEELDPREPHQDLRARWLGELGVVHDIKQVLTDPQVVVEAIALQNYRTGVAALSDPSWALGMFYSVEANFPAVCRRMYPVLKRRGYAEHSIALFASHATTDVEHSNEWLAALSETPLSPKERARVLRGGLAQIELRSQMFEAMRRQRRAHRAS